MKELFEALRMRRLQLRMSQSKLAELSGINRNTISKIEKGDCESIRLNTLSDISLALGLVWQMRMLPVEDLEKEKEGEK